MHDHNGLVSPDQDRAEFADDVAQLVGLGVDAEAAQAMTDAADLLAERTAKRTAELLAEQLRVGMLSAQLGEPARQVLARVGSNAWRQHMPIYLGPDVIEVRSNVWPDRIELELFANGEPCWQGVLRLG